MVTVKVTSGELTEEIVGAHGVVVMCGRPGSEVAKWNTFCHEKVGLAGPAMSLSAAILFCSASLFSLPGEDLGWP